MIVLIDNYDSFSYNVYQLIGSIYPDIRVIRNDVMTVEELAALEPEAIILSPGPGHPSQAGICEQVVCQLGNRIPLLGICLGHQAIVEAYGGVVSYAQCLMHGKSSEVTVDTQSGLFANLPEKVVVGRYHSLAAKADTLPSELRVIATADDGEIMAVQHTEYPVYGVQFHPESILTPDGKTMVRNFLRTCGLDA